MKISASQNLVDALAALAAAFDELGSPAMIIGGIAVIFRGVPRQTQDIDATIWGPDTEISRAIHVFQHHKIVPRITDARQFAEQNQVLLLKHVPSLTPIDLSFAWLPFESEALQRATVEKIESTSVRVASAQDLVVFKAVAWRDRDRSDIERLIVRHREEIDIQVVREIVVEFANALEHPERVEEFDKLIHRALAIH